MKTHFYVGAMESDYATIHGERREVEFLTRLDCVLTANNEKEAELIDSLLRATEDKEFIRSDSKTLTLVALSILNQREAA
jgi:hypothetical protein